MKSKNLKVCVAILPTLLSGCAYNWQQTEDVQTALVHKIVTPIAPEFCSKLLGGLKTGCLDLRTLAKPA